MAGAVACGRTETVTDASIRITSVPADRRSRAVWRAGTARCGARFTMAGPLSRGAGTDL
jgi:hypothetical protein